MDGVENRVGRKTEITNLLANLPRLGVGLAYREPFRDELLQKQSEVDFLEIAADDYLDTTPVLEEELELLAEHFTIVPHFMKLSLGSAEGLDEAYLEKVAALVKWLNPPWWSEHIGFTRAGKVTLAHPAPLPFTKDAVAVMKRNIITARRAIPTPLILENVCSQLVWPGTEMDEADFLNEVLGVGGCGLLLDVTNLFANAPSFGGDPAAFLERLPLDRVVQIHFSGGHESKGRFVDSRGQAVPEGVWQLLEQAVAQAPVRSICLERDDNLPPLGEVLWELERARAIGRQHRRWN
ncbi:MAG: hypothetical protein RLZZ265_2277 [Verrucomicrobiota bacterium]